MALRDDLVSWWEMNETSGTRYDSHGANDLTDNNTVGYAAGIQGNAADFEKSNSESLSITDAAQTDLEFTTDFTIQQWINFESINAGDMLACKADAVNQRTLQWLIFSSTSLRLTLWNSSNAATEAAWIGLSTMSTGTFYHIVLTYDVSAGTAELFIDGSSQGTKTGLPTSVDNSTANFSLGRWSGGGNYFDGLQDEVAVWKRVISSSEVTELFNSGAGMSYADTDGSSPTNTTNFFLMM